MAISKQRPFISAFVATLYVAVAITGIILLFHLKLPGIHSIHQGGGILFIIVGAVHLFVNWRPFTGYFHKNKAAYGTLAGLVAVVLIGLAMPGGERHGEPGAGNGHGFYERGSHR